MTASDYYNLLPTFPIAIAALVVKCFYLSHMADVFSTGCKRYPSDMAELLKADCNVGINKSKLFAWQRWRQLIAKVLLPLLGGRKVVTWLQRPHLIFIVEVLPIGYKRNVWATWPKYLQLVVKTMLLSPCSRYIVCELLYISDIFVVNQGKEECSAVLERPWNVDPSTLFLWSFIEGKIIGIPP